MFVSAPRHEGIDPADFGAINTIIHDNFLPVLRESPGFLLYALRNCEPDVGLDINDEEQPLFFNFRRYTGFNALDTPMITRLVVEDLIPVFVESSGFRLYITLNAMDHVLCSLTIFTTREAMHASTESAANFVAAELAPLLPQAPVVTEGRLGIFWHAPGIARWPL